MIRIDFVTLFPEMVLDSLNHSIMSRTAKQGIVQFKAVNPREFTTDNHRTVDDAPYGGGPGMILKVEPVIKAVRSLNLTTATKVLLTDPSGEKFTHTHAKRLADEEHLIFICGHYGGFDERIREVSRAQSFSIGDYVLTGGELPALVMTDSIVRLLPGSLGCDQSAELDSHYDHLLGHPQYTRPESFEGFDIPYVLRSGDHGAIAQWRREQSIKSTREKRPDLFWGAELEKEDVKMLLF